MKPQECRPRSLESAIFWNSRVFPLYGVTEGENWQLSPMPGKESIDAYLKIQDSFEAMGPEAEAEFYTILIEAGKA